MKALCIMHAHASVHVHKCTCNGKNDAVCDGMAAARLCDII